MPKKRYNTLFTKPAGTPPHSFSSTSKDASGANPSDAPQSVNDLLTSLRRSQITPETNHETRLQTRTMPPSLHHLLDLPSTPAPRPRRRQRLDATGRRLPAGPAPPQSWLETSIYAPTPKPGSHSTTHRGARSALYHLPGTSRIPRRGSLVDHCLRSMAEEWGFQSEYNQYHLAPLPTPLRSLLLSYIAHFGPAGGVGYEGLKRLLQLPEDDQSGQVVNNEDFRRLDLASSAGRSLNFKQLTRLLSPALPDVASAAESWDAESPPRTISAFPLSSLTHLSLADPGPSASWSALLAFAAATPTLTHLSLAYWPAPNLTPNATAVNAKMSARGAPAVNLAAEDRYAHSLDEDYSAAAAILRRLAKRWYSLEYLDVDGCAEWWKGLYSGWEGERVDWGGDWGGVRCVAMRSGEGVGRAREARNTAKEFQWYVRRWRGWIDVLMDEEDGLQSGVAGVEPLERARSTWDEV